MLYFVVQFLGTNTEWLLILHMKQNEKHTRCEQGIGVSSAHNIYSIVTWTLLNLQYSMFLQANVQTLLFECSVQPHANWHKLLLVPINNKTVSEQESYKVCKLKDNIFYTLLSLSKYVCVCVCSVEFKNYLYIHMHAKARSC